MKKHILSLLVAVGLIGSTIAAPTALPVRDYAKLLIGSWEAGKYTFNFSPDGTYSRVTGPIEFNPNKTEGTWKIIKDSLILDHSDLPIKIYFKDQNNFTWDTPMRHWDVSRENPN